MPYSFGRSTEQFRRSQRHLARGVATGFRAAQRPVPVCFSHGKGSRLFDIDGNEYVDYVLGFGPLLLGHSPEPVIAAVEGQLHQGLGFGASHELEAELAEAVCRTVPSAELCIFSNTGSEAVHVALRLARAATGRPRIVKFLGHYHGWFDGVNAGVSPQADARPATDGQDTRALKNLTVATWNDIDALEAVLGEDVAAVIMEPVNINGGTILPKEGFLAAALETAHRHGALVVFDEVITGYRLALGGAQERYGITPDLTVLGKALGSGFPVSAVCGREDLLSLVADGKVNHVGTFNANPVCAAAALATILELERGGKELYNSLEEHAVELATLLRKAAASSGVSLAVNQVGGVLQAHVSEHRPTSYEAIGPSDRAATADLVASLLRQGVHVLPDGRFYVSAAHTAKDLQWAADAAEQAMGDLTH